ncbi:MAG: bifunctional adenosylcobinamide kinase/adenosylcobinamide-phosphate guanylyltransferase [Gammaproteobacteria bacterium]
MKTLLVGGARCGKSRLAARWASARSVDVACLVTARASDAEMAARIDAHRRERPSSWIVREAFVELAAVLQDLDRLGRSIVIDCLTLWTSNCLWSDAACEKEVAPDLELWHRERDAFLAALAACRGEVIAVSNEVGEGIVPVSASARLFRDEHGVLNQSVGAICDEAYLVVAGLPLQLKRAG